MPVAVDLADAGLELIHALLPVQAVDQSALFAIDFHALIEMCIRDRVSPGAWEST